MNLFNSNFQTNPHKAAINSIKTVAHDLRNPAISIKGFSELLLKETETLTNEQIEFLKIIKENSETLLAKMEELLDASKIEENKTEINFTKENLTEITNKQVKNFMPIAAQKNIKIIEAYENIDNILVDKNKITHVIDNLISNAIKYSKPQSEIKISVTKESNSIKLSVKDSGIGIEVNEQKFLFATYPNISTKPTAGEKSTGIGLAIAKKIAELHKGTIEYENKPDKGSIFNFKIPIT